MEACVKPKKNLSNFEHEWHRNLEKEEKFSAGAGELVEKLPPVSFISELFF